MLHLLNIHLNILRACLSHLNFVKSTKVSYSLDQLVIERQVGGGTYGIQPPLILRTKC